MPKSTTGFLVNKIEDYEESEIPSLAVIPFENKGGKEEKERRGERKGGEKRGERTGK